MSDLSSKFITTSDIKIITIRVSEKINSQFISDFIKTTIESKYIKITNDTFAWYSFIEEVNLYEIYILDTPIKDLDIYPNILDKFYGKEHKKDTIDLFVLDDFFAVYKYGELYSFKSVKNSSIEDIQNYITQTYKLTLDNTIQYTQVDFDKLLDLYGSSKKNKIKFIKLNEDNTHLLFILFLVSSILIFLLILFNLYTVRQETLHNKLLKAQNKYERVNHKKIVIVKIVPEYIKLFKYIKLENLLTHKISYQDNTIQLDLLHQKKAKLLNFLTVYSGNISIDNIEYIVQDKLYKMSVELEI